MHGLTEADYRTLEARGIRVVCDFRDQRERTEEPASWPEPGAPRVLSDDYELDRHFFPPHPQPLLCDLSDRPSAAVSGSRF